MQFLNLLDFLSTLIWYSSTPEQLFCPFSSREDKRRTMSSLRHRILPPQLLLKWPKEASFCLWLLHPEPSSRPKMRWTCNSLHTHTHIYIICIFPLSAFLAVACILIVLLYRLVQFQVFVQMSSRYLTDGCARNYHALSIEDGN